jgi:hypothetical protein
MFLHTIGSHLFWSFYPFLSADAFRANLGSDLPFSAKSQGVYLFIREFRASWTSLGQISKLRKKKGRRLSHSINGVVLYSILSISSLSIFSANPSLPYWMPCTCFLVSIRRSSFNVWTYELLQRRSFRSIPSTFLYRLRLPITRLPTTYYRLASEPGK